MPLTTVDEIIQKAAKEGKVEPRIARRVLKAGLKNIQAAIEANERFAIPPLGIFIHKTGADGTKRILFRPTKRRA